MVRLSKQSIKKSVKYNLQSKKLERAEASVQAHRQKSNAFLKVVKRLEQKVCHLLSLTAFHLIKSNFISKLSHSKEEEILDKPDSLINNNTIIIRKIKKIFIEYNLHALRERMRA